MTLFEHAVAATRGARENQEDTAAFWPGGDLALFSGISAFGAALPGGGSFAVLADGMGGHTGGALASRMVCEKFLATAVQHQGSARERLTAALHAANAALALKIADNPLLTGMGSTLIGTAFSPGGIEWISVGDSPLYLFRAGEVRILNEDHSLAPELDKLVALGRMTEREARLDPRRHMLRSAVTGEEIDMIDATRAPFPLERGDYIVLASDGVDTLENDQLAEIITSCGPQGAEAVARTLIRTIDSLREPGQDNATVVVVRSLE